MKTFARYAAMAIALLAALVYFNNTNYLTATIPGAPVLLAHRGLAQTFDLDGVEGDTCTATRIHPPEHSYLENTLPSMREAFRAGADVVEFDIHPTTDGHFAVFHDWTLDCRTDGRGVTRMHSLAQLKALDIGYGYTADGGRTFPFRGLGTGMMTSLDEVLDAFPDRRLLINIKSNDPHEGHMLSKRLRKLPASRRALLMVYGGDAPIDVVRQQLPGVLTLSRQRLKACLVRYIAIGWTGLVPDACEMSLLLIPVNYASWFWGWPDRFLNRMSSIGTQVFVAGRHRGGDFSSDIDTAEDLKQLPRQIAVGIWTNRIDRIAPLVRAQ